MYLHNWSGEEKSVAIQIDFTHLQHIICGLLVYSGSIIYHFLLILSKLLWFFSTTWFLEP